MSKFEDFEVTQQVISYTDYDAVKIKNGEPATTSVFNRSLVDSINRDAALESALTYLTRSSSLYTTTNTKLLSHCNPASDGIDVVSFSIPETNVGIDEIFQDEPDFIGAAYAQRAVRNMVANSSTVDSALTTLDLNTTKGGWTVATTGGAKSYSFISDETTNTTISTLDIEGATTAGTFTLTSTAIPFNANITGNVGTATKNQFSVGVLMTTKQNMIVNGTKVTLTLQQLNSSGGVLKTHTKEVQQSSYNGPIKLEGLVLVTNAVSFRVIITVNYTKANVKAAINLKNVMVNAGGVLNPYVKVDRSIAMVKYPNVIDGAKPITVMSWSKFKLYPMQVQAGPIGPIYLNFNGFRVGGVHVAQDAGNLVLKAYTYTGSGSPTYGPSFTLPAEYIDKWLLTACRIRPREGSTTEAIFEFAAVINDKIYKSQVVFPKSKLTTGSLYIGSDDAYSDMFMGPVTEVRYDQEWVNDMELYIISLAHKAFSHSINTADIKATQEEVTVKDELDTLAQNPNLLLNPSGALAYVGWNNYLSVGGFSAVHNDVDFGNCFVYRGTAAENYEITSDIVTVRAGRRYTLRALMTTADGSTGEAGIGIRFYRTTLKNGTIIEDTGEYTPAETITTTLAEFPKTSVVHIGIHRYYTCSFVAPANANGAAAVMYINKGYKSNKTVWTKLKLEQGAATPFSDDSGAQYALYYDTDVVEVSTTDKSSEETVKNVVDTSSTAYITATKNIVTSIDSQVFNPNIYIKQGNIVHAGGFEGNLTGNVTGTASKVAVDAIYPVGSVYISVKNTNPSTLFGGTWASIGAGAVLMGVGTTDSGVAINANANGTTYGSNSRTLVAGNIPQLTHSGTVTVHSAGAHVHGAMGENYSYTLNGFYNGNRNNLGSSGGLDWDNGIWNTTENGAHTHTATVSIGAHGSANPSSIDITPRHVGVYFWLRTT